MLRTAILATLLATLAAGFACAQDLSGSWRFERMSRSGAHVGTLVIDRSGEVRLRARSPLQVYSQCGEVRQEGKGTEVVFTSVRSTLGYSLDHFYCTRRGVDALECYNIDGNGREKDLFTVSRTGGVPDTPAERLEGVCPPPETPRS